MIKAQTKALPSADYEALVIAGYRLATRTHAEPTLAHAAWALLVEMHESLARLPDNERRWLTSGNRAHHPPVLRSYWENLLAEDGGHTRCWGEPSPGAFDRMEMMLDVVMALPRWRHKPRDMRIAEALARGVGGGRLRRPTGMDRRRLSDVKARVAGELAKVLEARSTDNARVTARHRAVRAL